ncbi:bifunctional diaminohydroxyphosphoribosylaminopyrimidine deaminase/5-amino-6-(5-phosphoribosylamino)uracil reductase RibD [Chthonobacter albigriseus]|uniref:bifunctional diaminohydroxyphosphoribosylaminopyrimidine deaminase/5-amino-6-(5-phosphoribosylamino)uracil reductase RibD n=1 Tax=Chthonobacter albigriseus TaxID=1683161 RepID=UPI0015EF3113|nr:bifunctional diaminohydroxyphosphoribosylaminopyrimidine deaminase/5-amino-6-(5-phosphoribosylamino)uracil reductase RibD [Chthonobacter albigriseus]
MIPVSPRTQPGLVTETDRRFMAAAIALGRRNNGRAWPNPSVGAILVRKGPAGPVVVGRGTTAPGGRPHAEVIALGEAGAAARGATAYVTLEPCAHHGKTPPCSEALVREGVSRVVVGIEDPDPRVRGKGLDLLARHGITVVSGVLAREAERLHAGHIRRVLSGRPHVSLKLALSADGFIGRAGDGQVAISCPLSKAYAHTLRVENEAIMVGIGTVLADDPELTCRLPGLLERSPIRVIADADARTPPAAKIVTSARAIPTWIVVAPDAPESRVGPLMDAGCRIFVAERTALGRLDLSDLLFQLGREGITRVVSEGGATIARSLLEAGLADELHFVHSPKVVGDGGVPALAGLNVAAIERNPRFEVVEKRRLGDDTLVHLFAREIG